MKTSITIEKETAQDLNLMKYALGLDTIDDVINKLIISYKNHKQNEGRLQQHGTEDKI